MCHFIAVRSVRCVYVQVREIIAVHSLCAVSEANTTTHFLSSHGSTIKLPHKIAHNFATNEWCAGAVVARCVCVCAVLPAHSSAINTGIYLNSMPKHKHCGRSGTCSLHTRAALIAPALAPARRRGCRWLVAVLWCIGGQLPHVCVCVFVSPLRGRRRRQRRGSDCMEMRVARRRKSSNFKLHTANSVI